MAVNSLTETGSAYSAPIGLVYVFNLIVGTGALTMPKAFAGAGWAASVVLVIALAFMSYVTATFIIEAMASANAMRRLQKDDTMQTGSDEGGAPEVSSYNPAQEVAVDSVQTSDETTSLLGDSDHRVHNSGSSSVKEVGLFAITERLEMGQMATMFFNKTGRIVFYITLLVYLYGDLAIYAAAVPRSLRDVVCTYRKPNGTKQTLHNGDLCWPGVDGVNRENAYRVLLSVFTFILGPFVFFNVQKTKYLQMFTTLMRWLAFSMMIILAVKVLAEGQGQGHPKAVVLSGIPTLFGACVYSFMCHHSLPSLVTPIRDKSKLHTLFGLDYALILAFYCILAFTGIFTFPTDCLNDLYTLDFQPDLKCESDMPQVTNSAFIRYYLSLFPVFTLSTNFPIIGITLRNNLKALCYRQGRTYRWSVDRIVFPLATLLPPIALAFVTDNIQFLVGITGSFGGSGIQYFVPASLVLLSRKQLRGKDISVDDNKYRSPFKHRAWPLFVFVWAVICIVFVTVNHIMNWIHGKW